MKLSTSINIWSGSTEMNGLGAALTNPTELSFKKGEIKRHYPVIFNNKQFVDAEAAYQTYRTGYLEPDKQIMTAIIKAKLEQHPQLISAITFRGGVRWLETCSHQVAVKDSRWEGVGRKSNFIVCLIEAYTEVIAEVPF